MTVTVLIALVFFISSIISLALMLAPKISTLSSIDIESIPHERDTKAKDRILYERLRRRIKELEQFLLFAIHPIAEFFKQFFHAISHTYKRLSDAREFQKRQWFRSNTATSTESIDSEYYLKSLKDADDLVRLEKYDDAEMKYIDLISRNKDGLMPYHSLISLYSVEKEWGKARDIGEYLVKVYRSKLKVQDGSTPMLESDAAKISALLSDIYLELDENERAFQSIRRAHILQSNSPKILDACIEIAILLSQRLKAEKYLDQLREVNQENQKITEFDARIKQLPY